MMKEAEVHIRKGCELGPPNNDYWIGLAYFLIDSEIDVEEGIEIAERFLELYPNSGNIRRIIAFGLFKQGNYEEAYKLIKEAIEKFPYYDQEFEDLSREIEQALANQKSEY